MKYYEEQLEDSEDQGDDLEKYYTKRQKDFQMVANIKVQELIWNFKMITTNMILI